MRMFKGFREDMTGYRHHKYEVGKTYEMAGEIELCKRGYHACEKPLDVFKYYAPSISRYCEVELEGISPDKDKATSKRCGNKITIGPEIGVKGIVKEFIDWGPSDEVATKEDDASIAATGKHQAAAVCKGICSNAVNSGSNGAAYCEGYSNNAVSTGEESAAIAKELTSNAVNTGGGSAAICSREWSNAVNTGDRSLALTEQFSSIAANTGSRSIAKVEGNRSIAANVGFYGDAVCEGYQSIAVSKGVHGNAVAEGEQSVAMAMSVDSAAKGGLGCFLVLTEWGETAAGYYLEDVKAVKVDGTHIKANTYYTLKNGEIIPVVRFDNGLEL